MPIGWPGSSNNCSAPNAGYCTISPTILRSPGPLAGGHRSNPPRPGAAAGDAAATGARNHAPQRDDRRGADAGAPGVGVPQPQEDYLDLVSLLQSLVEDVRFEDQDHPLILQIASEQECLLPCHGELLWRAFDNLVRNALQHTPSGAEIRIRLEELSDEYLITIEDTGPGIPPELLAEVFEPFHHAGDTRGHGLGLPTPNGPSAPTRDYPRGKCCRGWVAATGASATTRRHPIAGARQPPQHTRLADAGRQFTSVTMTEMSRNSAQ